MIAYGKCNGKLCLVLAHMTCIEQWVALQQVCDTSVQKNVSNRPALVKG